MAVRVENADDLTFGEMAAERTATHCRIQDSSGNDPIIKALNAPVTAQPGETLRIRRGMMDVVYPHDEATSAADSNGHIAAVVRAYWAPQGSGRLMQIDLMTDENTVISGAGTGYTQATSRNWAISTEAD